MSVDDRSGRNRWEDVAEREVWTPHQLAVHAIKAERKFTGMIAAGGETQAPAKAKVSLAIAAAADAAMDTSREACIAYIEAINDENLRAKAPMLNVSPISKSVESVPQLVDWHLQERTGQASKI